LARKKVQLDYGFFTIELYPNEDKGWCYFIFDTENQDNFNSYPLCYTDKIFSSKDKALEEAETKLKEICETTLKKYLNKKEK
jgi:hypothetical protein